MARKGENIYFRKDGRWEGRYIKGRGMDGKAKFGSVYGKQYSEVKRKLLQIKADYWLETQIRPFVKAGTCAGYRRNIENHILPLLGASPVKSISQEQIQAAVNTLRNRLAPSTLHGICRLLKAPRVLSQEELERKPCKTFGAARFQREPSGENRKNRRETGNYGNPYAHAEAHLCDQMSGTKYPLRNSQRTAGAFLSFHHPSLLRHCTLQSKRESMNRLNRSA